jgi:phage terminase large subunit-like protein
LRGDYADLLILDEWQLMNEDAWELVGAPMLLDNNGDAVFIYTPPSVRSIGISKARDKRHAAKLYQKALLDTSGRWAAFHFSSRANPFISEEALDEISRDMSALAYRQEILAEDIEDVPGALWKQSQIDALRVDKAPDLAYIVIPIDPSATSRDTSDEAGIVPVGKAMCNCKGKPEMHGFVLADYTLRGTPNQWANRAIDAYEQFKANRIIGEGNNGGEMIETVIRYAAQARNLSIPYSMVYASRGKETRAEPISALYEQGRFHHVGILPALEDEMTTWIPGQGRSPNRVDAGRALHLEMSYRQIIFSRYGKSNRDRNDGRRENCYIHANRSIALASNWR